MRLARTRIPRRTDLWPRVWRRQPAATAAVLLLLLLLAWQRARALSGTDFERYHNKTCTCLHAVDGDTIDIDIADTSRTHTRIRLWGVDTPETAKSDAGAMYFGPEASAFSHRLADGKPVRIVLSPDRSRDKYGRLLAYVYLGSTDTMLNEELIAQGYGYADRRFPHMWRERFMLLELRARKKKLGLWKDVKLKQMPPWRQRYETWRAGQEPPIEEPAAEPE